jgi:hypothetical protein
MQHTASEAVSNHAGVVVEADQDPQVVELHAVQGQGHSFAVENEGGA